MVSKRKFSKRIDHSSLSERYYKIESLKRKELSKGINDKLDKKLLALDRVKKKIRHIELKNVDKSALRVSDIMKKDDFESSAFEQINTYENTNTANSSSVKNPSSCTNASPYWNYPLKEGGDADKTDYCGNVNEFSKDRNDKIEKSLNRLILSDRNDSNSDNSSDKRYNRSSSIHGGLSEDSFESSQSSEKDNQTKSERLEAVKSFGEQKKTYIKKIINTGREHNNSRYLLSVISIPIMIGLIYFRITRMGLWNRNYYWSETGHRNGVRRLRRLLRADESNNNLNFMINRIVRLQNLMRGLSFIFRPLRIRRYRNFTDWIIDKIRKK